MIDFFQDAFDEALNQHEKDSGLADSCKNDDSSENDLVSPRSSKYNTNSSGGGCCDDLDLELDNRHPSLNRGHNQNCEAGMQTDFEIPPPPTSHPPPRSVPTTSSHRNSLSSLEHELMAVALQMEQVQRQCNAIHFEPQQTRPPKPPRAPRTSSLPQTQSINLSINPNQSKSPRQVQSINQSTENRHDELSYKMQSINQSSEHKYGESSLQCRARTESGEPFLAAEPKRHYSTNPSRYGLVKMTSPEFGAGPLQPRKAPQAPAAIRVSPQATLKGVAIHLPYGTVPDAMLGGAAGGKQPRVVPISGPQPVLSSRVKPSNNGRDRAALLMSVREDEEMGSAHSTHSSHIYEQIESVVGGNGGGELAGGSLPRSHGTKSASRRPVKKTFPL